MVINYSYYYFHATEYSNDHLHIKETYHCISNNGGLQD